MSGENYCTGPSPPHKEGRSGHGDDEEEKAGSSPEQRGSVYGLRDGYTRLGARREVYLSAHQGHLCGLRGGSSGPKVDVIRSSCHLDNSHRTG